MKLTIFLAVVSVAHSRTEQVPSNVDYDNNVMWIDSFEYLNEVLTTEQMDDLRRHSGTYTRLSSHLLDDDDTITLGFSLIYLMTTIQLQQ